MSTRIKRELPNDEYQAAVGANNASASNVFATLADLASGIADADALVVDVKINQIGGILKGQAVYVNGADGTNILVGKADYSTEATSSKTLGLIVTSGANNAFTKVITEGKLKGTGTEPLNTNSAIQGDPVWLGANGNLIYGLANKPYAPNHLVFIGVVVRVSATVGEIYVKVQNGFELDEIHNVDIITNPPIDNDVLTFDSVTGLWKNKQLPATYGASINPSLDPVIENTITDPLTLNLEYGDSYLVPIGGLGVWTGQDNNIATWDGTDWVYYTPIIGDITTVLTGTNAGNVYEFDGTTWTLIASTSLTATPFFLSGSNVDAGGNKTASIARVGKVTLGSNSGPLYNAPLTVRGRSVLENTITRSLFCSTANAAFVNTWYRVAFISINNTRYGSYKILFTESIRGIDSGFSAIIDLKADKSAGGRILAKVTVISHTEGYTLTEDNFKIYRNSAPAFGPLNIGIYYRPTLVNAFSTFTVLNGYVSDNAQGPAWYNTNLGTTITDTIFDTTNRANIIQYGIKNNYSAIIDPTVNDDAALNYWIGSRWINKTSGKAFTCTDNTIGAAVWKQTSNDTLALYNQQIQDEGSSLAQRNIINFVGNGVTASDIGGKTQVTINGGGAGGTLKTIQLGIADVTGGGTTGIVGNLLIYQVAGSGGGVLLNNRWQFVIPADFVSGGTINLRVLRPTTAIQAQLFVYVNDVISNINGTSFNPTAAATYQTFSIVLTTSVVAGDTITINAQPGLSSGQLFNFRDVYFTYQS